MADDSIRQDNKESVISINKHDVDIDTGPLLKPSGRTSSLDNNENDTGEVRSETVPDEEIEGSEVP